jgi:hypothetical protein
MKHDWQKNVVIFRRRGHKVRIHTVMGRTPAKALALLYAESVNMLEGLTEEEATTYFSENPAIVPLYEIDIIKEAEPYYIGDDTGEGIIELGRAREALEKELAVS